ncbi:MAG TPA: hypothetical protein VJL82_04155 [Rhizomicrobium sp.]|nr:hypothetical protein [Rhizomicrobium sp.]
MRLRATFRRQEIRSPPDRSRSEWRARAIAIAQWAPWEVTAAVAIFISRHQNPAPEKAQRQYQSNAAMICEVERKPAEPTARPFDFCRHTFGMVNNLFDNPSDAAIRVVPAGVEMGA